MLTRKQHDLLVYIAEHLQEDGVSPSFEEMKEALGLKSKSGIHRLISALEERGFIRRLPHRARALEILRMPDGAPSQGQSFTPRVIDGRLSEVMPGTPAEAEPSANDAVALPLYGKIAAGTPIEALRDYSSTIDVPPSMLLGGEHYALTVEGDSMVEAGILDGDTVVIKRCETANTGEIVVALVDNEEATLKRLRKKGESIALEPANAAYETRIFGPDRVAVQGRLVGLLRDY